MEVIDPKYTFKESGSLGGYGEPSAGYYDISKKGFKPYGGIGQSAKNNLNIAFDMEA